MGHPSTADESDKLEFVGAVTDITERKRAEEALSRIESYLAEGQRLAHTGSWAFNPAGFFEYWSRELFQIYGFDPAKGASALLKNIWRAPIRRTASSWREP